MVLSNISKLKNLLKLLEYNYFLSNLEIDRQYPLVLCPFQLVMWVFLFMRKNVLLLLGKTDTFILYFSSSDLVCISLPLMSNIHCAGVLLILFLYDSDLDP